MKTEYTSDFDGNFHPTKKPLRERAEDFPNEIFHEIMKFPQGLGHQKVNVAA
jgi:hypothetical protein